MTDGMSQNLQTAAGLLGLMRLPGVGPVKAVAYASGRRPLDDLDARALERGAEAAAEQIDNYVGAGVETVGYFDRGFPEGLKLIPGAPAVVYFRGEPSAWSHPALAVVGTRDPTDPGERATRLLTAAAVDAGFTIISGLALGVDAIAHQTAIDHNGRTAAVLGTGLDVISPRAHRTLSDRILSTGGALLSEYPFGTEPSAPTLISRNRLQAGLAQALLVTETGLDGGTIHTVRFAAEQGKVVFCPAPQAVNEKNAGLVALLNQPASELPDVFPAWSKAASLAAKLGRQPLAREVRPDGIAKWLEALASVSAGSGGPSGPSDGDGQMQMGF